MLGYLKISPYIIYLQINDNDVVRNLFKDDINIDAYSCPLTKKIF